MLPRARRSLWLWHEATGESQGAMMDLLLYEAAPPPDLQGRALGSAVANLRDVQDQAAAWLRKVVLTVVPDLAARAGGTKDRHVLP